MYYLIEITTTDTTAKAIYQYENIKDAIANFHSKLGSQMKNDSCVAELCMVIDENGVSYNTEKYNKPMVEEPEE